MTMWSRPALLATCVACALVGGGVARADAPLASASASTKTPLPPLSALPSSSAHAPPPKPVASAPAPKPPIAPTPPKAPATVTATSTKKPTPALAKATKTASHSNAKTPGVRLPDAVARRGVAGGPTADDVALGAETPELHALHQAELELFPPAIPLMGTPWPNELASPLSATEKLPHVHATGLPPSPPPSSPQLAEGGHDLSWLSRLQMPDLPVRWDARLVRYLEFYKDDPRGRQLLAFWMKRSGRYREAIRRALRKKALPEDLCWLAMIESGYDPMARSPAGAAGLWQLTADTAHLYGLSTDRWADQRFNAVAETEAAVEMLSDLNRRFGSWELAMAAYNMGYGGVMSVVRRYNTNDYWALSKLEAALPWETVLYVPKLVAAAIVGRNLAVFGLTEANLDAPVDGDEVRVPPGTSLQSVASAAGCSLKEVESLNLELRAGRTPPAPAASQTPSGFADASYPVRVPLGKGAIAQANLAKNKDSAPALERYVVKFGESLEQVAASRKMQASRLAELNAIAPGEVVRGGTVLLLPRISGATTPSKTVESGFALAADTSKPVVVVPPDMFVYPDRRRVFYRVLTGDTLPEIASHLHVEPDDLRRWNDLDPSARLQDGMTLQVFVPEGADLSHAVILGEHDARVLVSGTEDFFAYWEGTKGKRRLVVTAKAGETIESIGRKNGVNAASMERINGRGRKDVLKEGETVVVYLPAPGGVTNGGNAPEAKNDLGNGLHPVPNGPLPTPPEASLLPALP
jgi:membrane-bound lytic murein transglycosylase D